MFNPITGIDVDQSVVFCQSDENSIVFIRPSNPPFGQPLGSQIGDVFAFGRWNNNDYNLCRGGIGIVNQFFG